MASSRQISKGADLRVVSWNLLRRVGACVEDIARLVKSHHPDLLFLQEATEEVTALPGLVGGHFFRHAMDRRIYGLAAWSPHPFPQTTALRLPASVLPGRVPPRHAQLVQFRRHQLCQCASVARPIPQSLAVAAYRQRAGGSRRHYRRFQRRRDRPCCPAFAISGRAAAPIAPPISSICRLDRCLARDIARHGVQVLERGASDHHPIVLDLALTARQL